MTLLYAAVFVFISVSVVRGYSTYPEAVVSEPFKAEKSQFPYQVGIAFKKEQYSKLCSGSIISSTYILTAAQCTKE